MTEKAGAMTSLSDHVEEVFKWLAAAGIDRLELAGPSGMLTLTRSTLKPDDAEPTFQEETSPAIAVTSPGVGLFRDRHPWRDQLAFSAGRPVNKDDTLGFLHVGVLLMPITAPTGGNLSAFKIEPGAVVGYGDILAEIVPLV